MKILGVIPAAGKGSRWGGVYKELLPIEREQWLLNRCIDSMSLADEILIVTTAEKISTHASHLGKRYPNVSFTIQKERNDIMGAIQASYPFAGDINLFAMPDTLYPLDMFYGALPFGDFSVGIHKTTMPERFGVIYRNIVGNYVCVNKTPDDRFEEYDAWGSLVWSKNIAELWDGLNVEDYTLAINVALNHVKEKTTIYPMEYYYDMASWKDYLAYIKDKEE